MASSGQHRIAVIGGDGIGPEVTSEALKVIAAAGIALDTTEFSEVTVDYNHIDAACIYMVEQPGRYDVIVTDNLFGDILTDLAGAVAGGIGFAASANLNAARTGPSLFEPVHGAAHDIAGQAKANPLAAISSAALMLEHLGESEAATKIIQAVNEYAMSSPQPASTSEVGDAIAGKV